MFAMNGLIHHFDFDRFQQDPARVADWAFLMADAMLEARKPKEEKGIVAVKRRKKSNE